MKKVMLLIKWTVGNWLDNVSDGDVQNAVVERVNLDSAADQGMTQRDRRGVDEVGAFTTKPRVWLVFHNEHDVRWKHRTTFPSLPTGSKSAVQL